ncbi:uncharacterized protein LOC143292711 [Babylonia areolata]|uniref:uncharacterized protein LOC143292711 n=1 Tax=Babylonia areolata TaxID=304850 RepID=UPI003FD66D2D
MFSTTIGIARAAPSVVGRAIAMAKYHGGAGGEIRADVGVINLRSDTFTLPTAAMKEAMITAPLGDDVFGEDPTVNKLQEECAALLGKEAALLVPTGTMGNLAAILSHCTGRFEEVLLGDQSHIYLYEVGGISALAGVQPRAVQTNPDGTLDLADLVGKIRDRSDTHYPFTTAICLENTHNKCGGKVLPLDYIKKVREVADANNLVMHLDGARLMNAATALQVPASHIAQYFHSISMCFSKGLACPVGSVLAGSREFISRARKARKALGGGMRQAGVIAAPMLVALKDIVPLLKEDHARARRIAQAVADLGTETVLTVDVASVQTNILMLQTTRKDISADQVCERLAQVTEAELQELGEPITVLTGPFSKTTLRLVTYYSITDEDVEKSIRKIQYVLKEMASL